MRLIAVLFVLFSYMGANVGEITLAQGKVNIVRDDKIISGKEGMTLQLNDVVNTFERSRVQIRFEDNTIVTLGRDSRFILKDYLYEEQQKKTDFSFTKGLFKVVTGEIGKVARQNFKLHTKTATIGIRGTEIDGFVSDEKEIITCSKGAIWVEAYGKRVDVDEGQSTIIKPDTPPSEPKNYRMEKLIRDGIIAYEAKRYEEARDIFAELIGMDVKNPIFHYYMGKSYFGMKDYPLATKAFKTVLELDKLHMKSRYELGVIYYMTNELEKAIEEFDIIIAAGKEEDMVQPQTYIMSLYWLGMIYRDKGDSDLALEHWNRVLGFKLKPDFREKVNGLIAQIK